VVVILLAGAASCGDDAEPTTDPAQALSYMPAEPALLAIVDTDVDGDQVRNFEDVVGENVLGAREVEDILEEAVASAGLSYEDDVEPLLGGPLAVAIEDEGSFGDDEGEPAYPVVAIEVGDEDKLRDALEKVPEVEDYTAVEDGVFVASESRQALAAARARHADGDGLDPAVVDEALRDLPDEALVKVYADLDDGLLRLPELAPLADAPWFDTVTTLGAAISFDDPEMRIDALVSTDGARPADLPVVPGSSDAPAVVTREGWISGANLNQSQTTTFLLRTVRSAFPDSDFVRDVATVEREREIDFEEEFLRQFDGPSQSLLAPDGRFAARSEVSDPGRLAATMEKIAPDLGRLVEDLQALRSSGLGILLLLAPDAPAATSVLDSANVRVRPLGDDLYRMSGLEGPGPDQIVFGLVDGAFVVAEDEQAAAEIAAAPTEEFDGPPGAAVARASGQALADAAADFIGIGTEGLPAREVSGALETAPDGLRARLVAEFGG
jgi:hypothetical protein